MKADLTELEPSGPGMSFQSRITIVAMITAVAVLAAACAAFIAEQWRTTLADHAQQQVAVAGVIASGPTVQAAIRDPAKADQTLSRLKVSYPAFKALFVLDPQGRRIAGYGAPSVAAAAGLGLWETHIPIRIAGRPAGEVVSFTPRPHVWSILPRYLALTAALFFAATGLALFLGRWLAGRVTEPVGRLSQVMRTVADSGDFGQRVERIADDELGRLTDSFNRLLAKLADNDQALRRTMAELVEARDHAESANLLKSQFLANMSHEIRTPLNGLLAMTQIMAMDAESEVQRGRLSVIRQSGEALLGILNDVLDVSKIEAGKLELELGDFDVRAELEAAKAAFAPVAEKKGLNLVLDVRPEAQGARRGDAARLRQIVNNLVSNALKFTPAGEVRILVEATGAAGAEGLRIRVSDTGIGIPPDAVPHLFQKFTQADASTTRRFGGTGLGLAICLELAELMGGGIRVESREGVGSCFEVELPLPRAAGPVAATEPASPLAAPSAEPVPAEPAGEAIKVLAAEDNPTNQLVLTTVMGIFGVDLTLVGNGRLAVEAWRDGEFDLILMDIQMPEMDGLAATRAIRAAEAETGRKRTPIIALSAHAMTHQVQEYLAAGIDVHVPKPIEIPKLQAAMEQVVAGNDDAAEAAA